VYRLEYWVTDNATWSAQIVPLSWSFDHYARNYPNGAKGRGDKGYHLPDEWHDRRLELALQSNDANDLITDIDNLENSKTVSFLLDHGADPNATFESGEPIMKRAIEESFADTVALLIRAGADVSYSKCGDSHDRTLTWLANQVLKNNQPGSWRRANGIRILELLKAAGGSQM
jgi:hypothetical protein